MEENSARVPDPEQRPAAVLKPAPAEELREPSQQQRYREHRNLLVALSAAALSPDAACRLARGLDAWWPPPNPASTPEIAERVGVSTSALREALALAEQAEERARAEQLATRSAGGEVVTLADGDYPNSLLELELPPPAIHIRGRLDHTSPAIAIVGPRNADLWALDATRRFAQELAAAGLVIVSGFARGVDVQAHQAALDAGGRTVAVLGSGLGVPYPRQHYRLADAIAAAGAVVTEFPTGRAPQAWHFPIRNRLIAALSCATLVIQASDRSGTLITAREALELGRDVYALPGRITDARSRGSNRLLRDGALLALDPDTLLEGLSLSVQAQLRSAPGAPAMVGAAALEAQILAALEQGTLSAESLSRQLAAPIEDVLVALLELELRRRVERIAGNLFRNRG